METDVRLPARPAARYMGVPESTLKYWRAHGVGPRHYKLGRRIMYDRADLDAFIAASKAEAR